MTEWVGLIRSLIIYWRPGRQAGLRRLYRPFVNEGDLVFDIGAHLGDRTAAFSSLGARVVALEPQPHLNRWLDRLVGRREGVTVRAEAVGRLEGTATLAVSLRNPTVSTLSSRWREALPIENSGFRRVRWDRSTEVTVTTLDALIEEYGRPAFCKIDVEGYEADVLAGLDRPVPALSLEFVHGALDLASRCVETLERLAPYEYQVVLGERRRFHFDSWRSKLEIITWLEDGAEGASSGDVYARLRSGESA